MGGDLGTTHLVKGLDRKLLERVKAGEDVVAPVEKEDSKEDGGDVDDEFDKLLEEREKDEVPVAKKEEKIKQGTMAAPPKRMTRDEILRQLKASRAAGTSISSVTEPPVSTLGGKFKKIGAREEKKRWIETDQNGRRKEILLVTDSEGKQKRKVRWLDKFDPKRDLLSVDKTAKPLGMEVPAEVLARVNAGGVEEQEDDDIFEGVGAEYNPLADLDDGDSSSESEEGEEKESAGKEKAITPTTERVVEKDADQARAPRNYFSTGATADTSEAKPAHPLTADPTILAALKRAAAIRQRSPPAEGTGEVEQLDEEAALRRKKFLEEAQRRERDDAMDLDMGFGESRFGDDDDEEEVWEERGGNKRKRGPKKKKGNKDSASDVMKVLEGRKKASEK